MSNVTLAQADLIANEAIAKGRALNFLPLTVVVLDAGGHVVVTKREDGSGSAGKHSSGSASWCHVCIAVHRSSRLWRWNTSRITRISIDPSCNGLTNDSHSGVT